MREMLREVGRAWPALSPISQIVGSARSLIPIIAFASAAGLAIGWMVQQGWFV